MHRLATYGPAVALSLALAAGCALPKVALGASVSLGRSAEQDGAAHSRLRSALWIAMFYTPHTNEPDVSEPQPGAPSDMACAFEPACAFERDAIEDAEERELSP